MKQYLLDSNVLIRLLRERDNLLEKKLRKTAPEKVYISAGLIFGGIKGVFSKKSRSTIFKSRMYSVCVVITVNVIKDFCVGILQGFKDSVLKHFAFEGAKERFRPNIIIGMKSSGYTP